MPTPRGSGPPLSPDAFEPGPGVTYLNHAAAGLLPKRTRDDLVAMVDAQMREGVLGLIPVESHLDAFRERVARFIGARGREIAFLRNTGDGANAIARGFAWAPGDQIVLTDNEFGANALPWLAAREAGAEIVYVRAPHERMTPGVSATATGTISPLSPRSRMRAARCSASMRSRRSVRFRSTSKRAVSMRSTRAARNGCSRCRVRAFSTSTRR
jgi:selenocysteine lyase/cysteine desulfurase